MQHVTSTLAKQFEIKDMGKLHYFLGMSVVQVRNAVKRVMRYLRGTTKLGIYYSNECSNELIGYSDADWGGDINDRKST